MDSMANYGVETALFQPDIAGNVGTMLRLCACMAVPLHIIEPCGFPLGDRQLKRAAMDYGAKADASRHIDWDHFAAAIRGEPSSQLAGSQSSGPQAKRRIILLSSKASASLYDFAFADGDVLLAGSESAGVPDVVRDACDAAITIPMQPQFRSLNVAIASAMVLGEALRQTRHG